MTARVHVQFNDRTSRSYVCSVSPQEVRHLRKTRKPSDESMQTEIDLFERVAASQGIDRLKVRSFGVSLTSTDSPVGAPEIENSGGGRQSVKRARSLLDIAKVALPREVREDALDEWMDEIECAAAEDRPVLRRAISILVRALPALAWRSRLPTRARKPGSE